MGHIRLGTLPDTARWRKVVGLLADEQASVGAVAGATMEAAQRGLEIASYDEGLSHTLWLLTQIPLAAQQEAFGQALKTAGVTGPAEPSIFDIVGGFSDAVDRHLRQTKGRTDIGEMAQLAAAESLAALCTSKAASLFETTPADVRQAVKGFSTKVGFSNLAHDFFSRFTQRFLTYHLSREISKHVGRGQRFRNPKEHSDFIAHMNTHCRQAAVIVKEFAGGWFSKANYEGGITPRKARNFAYVAMKKIRAELKIRGGRDAD